MDFKLKNTCRRKFWAHIAIVDDLRLWVVVSAAIVMRVNLGGGGKPHTVKNYLQMEYHLSFLNNWHPVSRSNGTFTYISRSYRRT